MKNLLGVLFRIGVTTLLIYLLVFPASRKISPVFPLVDIKGLPSILRNSQKNFLVLAFFFSTVANVILAWRWKTILSQANYSFGFILQLTFIGLFFNNFLPTGAGGDVVKGYYFLKGREKKLSLVISILLDRVIGTLSVMSMGFVAGVIYLPYLPRFTFFVITAIFLALLFFFLLCAWPAAGRWFGRIIFLSHWGRPGVALKNFYYEVNAYLQKPGIILEALLLSFIGQFSAITANYFVTLGVNSQVSFLSLLVFIPLVWTFAVIPSLGGLGVRESGYLFFFHSQMGREKAFALGLLILACSVVNSFIGALIYFFGGGRWQNEKS